MKLKQIIIVLFIIIAPLTVFSQDDDYDWGDDIVTAKGKYLVLKTEMNAGNYELASGPVLWLLKNAPKLNVNLYIRAEKIYESRAEEEENLTKKQELQDSVLWVYDKRIEYFGDEAKVLNYKGKVAWKYLRDRPGNEQKLFALYQRIYDLNKDEIFPINATAYVFLACDEYRAERLTKQQHQNIFINISESLHKQREAAENEKSIDKYTDIIEKKFISCADLTCEDVEEIFGKKFKEDPTVARAKRLKNMLAKLKCLDNPQLIDAMVVIEQNEPSSGGSMGLGKIFRAKHIENPEMGYLDTALSYYLKAEQLAQIPQQQGEIYLELAKTYQAKAEYVKAREYAYKAIHVNYDVSSAYKLVGDLYFNSYSVCKTGNVLEDRAVFIAAYNMYERAGAKESMQNARQQFPSVQDIFNMNKEEGDDIKIDCWINETVKLQSR